MENRHVNPSFFYAIFLATFLVGACSEETSYVDIVEDNVLADGFDFPVEPGEMHGWREPPEADEAWDASSYLVHRSDGIHAAIDFMREDGSDAAGCEMWAIGDGVVGVDYWSAHLHFELRTTNLAADAWPQSMGLTTDEAVEEHYTHPLDFIRRHRPEG